MRFSGALGSGPSGYYLNVPDKALLADSTAHTTEMAAVKAAGSPCWKSCRR